MNRYSTFIEGEKKKKKKAKEERKKKIIGWIWTFRFS